MRSSFSSDQKTTEPTPAARRKAIFHPGAFRYSAVELLVALVLLLLSAPFIEDLPAGDLIEVLLVTAVMVSAVLVVGGRRRTLIISLVLVVPAVAGKWASHFWPSTVTSLVYLLAGMTFFGFIVIQLIGFILRAPRVNTNVLCAGLSGYLLLGLLWTPAYLMVARLNPSAFNMPATASGPATMDGFTGFYFSFMTLCTVGYGDITPVSRLARMLAVTEAIAGLFYVAVLISRLVAVYSMNPPPADPDVNSPQS